MRGKSEKCHAYNIDLSDSRERGRLEKGLELRKKSKRNAMHREDLFDSKGRERGGQATIMHRCDLKQIQD
jgi:hypothetical protein